MRVKKVVILPDAGQLTSEYDNEPAFSHYKQICLFHLNPHDETDREKLGCTDRRFKPKFPSESGKPHGEAIVFEPDFIGTSFLLEYYVMFRGSASGAFLMSKLPYLFNPSALAAQIWQIFVFEDVLLDTGSS